MPFLFSSPSLLLSPCLSLSHFASSSLQCVSLAPAQQLLFSDRSVKQKMMLGIKNRSWSKAQPPYSHNLLFCISSETLGIHSEVIICYSGAPCLSGTNDEVTSERATSEREIICYLTMLDNHRLVGLQWQNVIFKSHFLSPLISSCKTEQCWWLCKHRNVFLIQSNLYGVKIHGYLLTVTRVKTPLIPPLPQIDIREEIDMQTKSAES